MGESFPIQLTTAALHVVASGVACWLERNARARGIALEPLQVERLSLRGVCATWWCWLTYAAFVALARGRAEPAPLADVAPVLLTAVRWLRIEGRTTYLGNGPNLIVCAFAERSGHVMPRPSFAR